MGARAQSPRRRRGVVTHILTEPAGGGGAGQLDEDEGAAERAGPAGALLLKSR